MFFFAEHFTLWNRHGMPYHPIQLLCNITRDAEPHSFGSAPAPVPSKMDGRLRLRLREKKLVAPAAPALRIYIPMIYATSDEVPLDPAMRGKFSSRYCTYSSISRCSVRLSPIRLRKAPSHKTCPAALHALTWLRHQREMVHRRGHRSCYTSSRHLSCASHRPIS